MQILSGKTHLALTRLNRVCIFVRNSRSTYLCQCQCCEIPWYLSTFTLGTDQNSLICVLRRIPSHQPQYVIMVGSLAVPRASLSSTSYGNLSPTRTATRSHLPTKHNQNINTLISQCDFTIYHQNLTAEISSIMTIIKVPKHQHRRWFFEIEISLSCLQVTYMSFGDCLTSDGPLGYSQIRSKWLRVETPRRRQLEIQGSIWLNMICTLLYNNKP